jgi:hypothetical protein
VPWVLASSEALNKALAEEKVATCLTHWNRAYTKTPLYKDNDVVTAPMLDSQGNSQMKIFFDFVVPPALSITSKLPAFMNTTGTAKLFGESATYTSFDFEIMFLASLRVQVSGVSKFVLIPACGLVKALVAESQSNGTMNLTDLRDKVKALSGADFKTWAANGNYGYHVELNPKQCLYVPAGWLVGQATFNNQDCVAIKKACLVNQKQAVQAIRRSFEVA